MRVTFDSNVYRPVVDPSKFPDHPLHPHFEKIHRAVKCGSVTGLLCETINTLEGILRNNRAGYFSGVRPEVQFTEELQGDGSIRLGVSINPDDGTHPGFPATFEQWLQDAVAIGMRFMCAPRIGLPRNPTPESAYFPRPDSESLDRFHSIGRAIERRGVGRSVVKEIGARINQRLGTPDADWFRSLDQYRNSSERTEIARAVAEWADGDTVAAHYSYSNDVLCTEDRGHSAGNSVFSAVNRCWLDREYGIKFVSVEELATTIARL